MRAQRAREVRTLIQASSKICVDISLFKNTCRN